MNNTFIEIDYDAWDRREIFELYRDVVYCITVDVDVTRYIEEFKGKVKFYPFMNYVVSKVANSDSIYRMGIVHGKVGYYEVVHPLYTLLRANNLFTHKCTEYSDDFATFYHRFLADKEIGEASDLLYADGEKPTSVICTSTLPSTSMTSLSIAYDTSELNDFVPFPTFGRYYERDGRWYCPVAIEFFHAVNDGYHAERFFKAIDEVIAHINI